MVKSTITAFRKPVLEYESVVCHYHLKTPWKKKKIERVERVAKRWMKTLKDLCYEGRLDWKTKTIDIKREKLRRYGYAIKKCWKKREGRC